MIQIGNANKSYKNSTDIYLSNSFDIGLKDPLEISSTSSSNLNAYKTMSNKTISNDEDTYNYEDELHMTSAASNFYENGNHLDDDIYDFSNVKPTLHLETSSNNPSDDEEDEDINFDYGYGYDYERVIKDRLKQANQEFINDSAPLKKKETLVNFNNAVTAFDIPNGNDGGAGDMTENEDSSPQSILPNHATDQTDKNPSEIVRPKKSLQFNTTDSNQQANKLPLNDTVYKENPNSFADKLKEAVQRFDEEQEEKNQQLLAQRQKELNGQNDSFIEEKNSNSQVIHLDDDLNGQTETPPPQKTLKFNNNTSVNNLNKNNNVNTSVTDSSSSSRSQTPLSSPRFGNDSPTKGKASKIDVLQINNSNSSTKSKQQNAAGSDSKYNTRVVNIVSDADKENDEIVSYIPSHQESQSKNIKQPVAKQPLSFNNNKNNTNTTNTKNNKPTTQEPPQTPSKVISPSPSSPAPNNSPKKVASFSFSTNENNQDTLKPPEVVDDSASNNSSFNIKETDLPLSKPTSPQPQTEPVVQEKNNGEKMLIEKDGSFVLMNPDEYTAYEKKLAIERKQKIQNQKTPAKTNGNNSNVKAKPKLPPRPPTQQRPITSHENRNQSLKNRFINERLNNTSNSNSNTNLEPPRASVNRNRVSYSADFTRQNKSRSKSNSHSPATSHITPEYAQNYKSPYQLTVKVFKRTETSEEKAKQERQEQEKKSTNEQAFKNWLKIKEEQRQSDLKKKNEKAPASKKNTSQENICTSSDESKSTFDSWLKRKQEQFDKEREYKNKLDQINEKPNTSSEERTKAYKEWISRKMKEKKDALVQEKLESKKWIARRRRSRKHQRLSQALEMAQQYGYNSSYYSPGFTY